MSRSSIRIGITFGDIAGIGPEIVYQALRQGRFGTRIRFHLYGPRQVFAQVGRRFHWDVPPKDIRFASMDALGAFPLRDAGKPAARYGAMAVSWIREAVRDSQLGLLDALVTAPISKTACRMSGFRFKGHTDFIAHLLGNPAHRMMFYSRPLRVLLATHHLPLVQAVKALNKNMLVESFRIAHDAMRRFGIEKPRIVVAGLNPHAGEGGLLGQEEKRILIPAIQLAARKNLAVAGPFAPDTVFVQNLDRSDTVIVAMTHDQGLIPFKMAAFATGVNVTTGLPVIRTSPDHGTAYDIAWRGKADSRSMIEAIRLAIRMARRE